MNRPSTTHRYRLHRAGIRNVWQYDEQEFAFGEGRLLLRGKNGAGKSKALEMLLPYLLDGDARALDATGTGRTTLAWLMLDGIEQTNRLGYLWLEFARTDEDGDEHHLTVGAAVRASRSTKTAKPFFFTTGLRVGETPGLDLAPAGQPLSLDRLRALVGPENVTDRAVEHRARVARDLFGLTDPARYRNLLQLLHRLRRPTIGDRIDSGGLVSVLAETLPALDDAVVEKVARSLDDLDSVRTYLGRLERTDQALRAFLTNYRGYLHGTLRRGTDRVTRELEHLMEHRKLAGDAARGAEELRGREQELDARIDTLVSESSAAETELAALHASAGYRSLQELGEKRRTVAALHKAAATAFRAVRREHGNQEDVGRRLSAEARRLGGELVELSTMHGELLKEAERSGVDAVHLGDPVAAPVTGLARVATVELVSPEGDFHLVRHEEVLAVDTDTCTAVLRDWDARLEDAQPVFRNRVRFVTELGALVGQSIEARRRADGADAAREGLEEQADGARSRADEHRQTTARESESYAVAAGEWADRLASSTGVSMDGVFAVLAHDPADGPLPAQTPDEMVEAARSAVDPWLTELGAERDDVVLAVRELEARQATLRRRRDEWERLADPQPPPPPGRSALRAPGTGAPLYRLVDFSPDLPPDARTSLEAALEASGLLDAWVCADGRVLDPHTHDIVLVAGTPVAGWTLAQALRPVLAPGSGVTAQQTERVLKAVALVRTVPNGGEVGRWQEAADGDPDTVIGIDGSWKLGIARGRYAKASAEYVGAEVRAETRRRGLAEIDGELESVAIELTTIRERLRRLTEHRDQTGDLLRRHPPARGLTDAWVRTTEAAGIAESLAAQASKAAREAERARADAVVARREAEATASTQDLPADLAALEAVRQALDRLVQGTQRLRRRMGVVLAAIDRHRSGRADYEFAESARAVAESDYAEQYGSLETARRTLKATQDALGATEQEILGREAAARRRVDAIGRQLPPARTDLAHVHDERVRAEEDARVRREALAGQESEVLAHGRGLRAALSLPGVLRGAGLGTDADDGSWNAPDPVHQDVRERVAALRLLADAVRGGLDAARHDISDTTLLNRHTDLRDQLSGGYDATIEEMDGIKLCRLVDDNGTHDIAVVGERIAAEAAEARDRLTERERDVFQRFLTGELGDHLSAQVLAAGGLVAALNDTLATVRTSHGLGVTLDWKLADGVEADVKAAVDLLRSPSGLRTREQSEQLRDVLQRRIEDARRADPAAGYAAHLRTALDYRGWFVFTPWVVNDAAPASRRKLTGRTGLSQGEQRVLSYLVLFAAAAAHFTSLADAAPYTPRLILLDDAFAKVDEPTHARLGGILVDLDLDFVLTSERLMGNWPDVPSLHVYECLRDPHVRGVATLHYTWNGRQRRLMSV